MKTLEERMKDSYVFEFNKHQDENGKFQGFESDEEYADSRINAMSNTEFLWLMSIELQEMFDEVGLVEEVNPKIPDDYTPKDGDNFM